MKRSSLKEMDFLQDIKTIQNEYYKNYGHEPINVSDWNPSLEFKEKLQQSICMENNFNEIDYVFSYTFSKEEHNKILNKLGYNNQKGDRAILITPNGSSSIRNVLHWLKENNYKKLLTISPTYFTVFYGCNDYGIEYKEIFLTRSNSTFVLNEEILFQEIKQYDAVWVTNPVYCTSVYFEQDIIKIFSKILEMGKILISDESLCTTGHELLRQLGHYKNFIGIYSPHKSICVNGNKFSVITYNNEETILFNDWVVPLSGNLLISNGIAVNHYLSPNFELYQQRFNEQILINYNKLKQYLKDIYVDYDYKAEGYLITLYFPHIPGEKGFDKYFLKTLISSTGSTLIPGIRNHFGKEIGFCFRVNLCCLTNETLYALKRLIIFLNNL